MKEALLFELQLANISLPKVKIGLIYMSLCLNVYSLNFILYIYPPPQSTSVLFKNDNLS
jgi:hypothetical protein